MSRHLPVVFASLSLALLLAACQPQVKPAQAGPPEPPEPVTPVGLKPSAPVTRPPGTADAVTVPAAEPKRMDTGAEVFDAMSAGFSAPVCVDGPQNRQWRKRYAGYPESFANHLEQILPLMAYVVEEVQRRNLPGEFALIPIVESWYRPDAIGPGGPAGMWQMISSTARNHGIHIQPGYDGRLSPVESTDAALSYLEALSKLFKGEWRTMAMGYNAGEYRILRAFRNSGDQRVSGESHLPRGLSRTTYDYVAKLHALACLIASPERHGLVLPREARFVPLARMSLPEGAQTLDQAARELGTDAALLRALNPAYRQGQVRAGVPRDVLAPATALSQLANAGDGTAPDDPPRDLPRSHRVQRGDTLSRIASRHGVPLKQLFTLNGLGSRSILQPGQVIRIDP